MTQIAALIVAAIGCYTDLKSRKIPNVLTFGGAALGIALQVFQSGLLGGLLAVGGWFAGVLIVVVPMLIFTKKMGFGDAKLMGALGAFLGAGPVLLTYFFCCMFLGLTAGFYALRAIPWTKLPTALMRGPAGNISKNDLEDVRRVLKSTMPIAPGIFAGTICTVFFEKQALQFLGLM